LLAGRLAGRREDVTATELFAFVILPIVIAVLGWAIALYQDRLPGGKT